MLSMMRRFAAQQGRLINGGGVDASWNVSDYAYDSQEALTETVNPADIFFSDDGLSLYLPSGLGVYQYTLSTAWDISTLSTGVYTGSVWPLAVYGLHIDATGTKCYAINSAGNIYQGTMTTAWESSTLSYDSITFDCSSQESIPQAVYLDTTGLLMFVTGFNTDYVYMYNLSTAWDISTAVYSSESLSVGSYETAPRGLTFKPDGTKLYICGSNGDAVVQFDMTTAWSLTTATYSQSLDISSEEGISTGVCFRDDGTSVFVVGEGSDSVIEYVYS